MYEAREWCGPERRVAQKGQMSSVTEAARSQQGQRAGQ